LRNVSRWNDKSANEYHGVHSIRFELEPRVITRILSHDFLCDINLPFPLMNCMSAGKWRRVMLG